MLSIIYTNDPTHFASKNFQSNLTYEMVNKVLEIGPSQPLPSELPSGRYPVKNGHRFLPRLYQRILPDGTVIRRDWLSYSKSNECLYCIDCILFSGKGQDAPNKAWILNGFQNWSTCTKSIVYHETTSAHVYSSLTRKIRQSSLPLISSLVAKQKEDLFMNR